MIYTINQSKYLTRIIAREILGDDILIINLSMSKDEKRKRLMGRHGGDTKFVDLMEEFEEIIERNGGNDVDKSTIQLNVTGDMTKEEVAQEILKIVAKNI